MADCRSSFTKATIAGSGFAFGAMAVFPFPVHLLRPQRGSVPRSLATPCVSCLNKAMTHAQRLAMTRAQRLAKKRALHAQNQLQRLRRTLPELHPDILDRCSLRQLSLSIRRCGGPCQQVLQISEVNEQSDEQSYKQSYEQSDASSGAPMSLLCGPPPCLLGWS
jgi:hypothetical protein